MNLGECGATLDQAAPLRGTARPLPGCALGRPPGAGAPLNPGSSRRSITLIRHVDRCCTKPPSSARNCAVPGRHVNGGPAGPVARDRLYRPLTRRTTPKHFGACEENGAKRSRRMGHCMYANRLKRHAARRPGRLAAVLLGARRSGDGTVTQPGQSGFRATSERQ
jgi:hypothetical protein